MNPSYYDKEDYQLAFSMIPGLNLTTARQLAIKCAGEENFFHATTGALQALTATPGKHFTQEAREKYLFQAIKERGFVECNHISCLYYADEEHYPHRLAECSDGPVMLYKYGPCELDNVRTLAIVGTRRATAYGIEFTRRLVADLAAAIDNLVIISGLAYGIDVTAHKAALDEGIPTVAVLGQPLNDIYPAEHRGIASKMVKAGGALVTEYATCMPTHRGNFLARNRIIAGLSDAVLVVESSIKGGAMVTARIGAAYNREVFAVPGRVNDEHSAGCNRLIATNGAQLITCADDLIECMGWTRRKVVGQQKSLPLDISEEKREILQLIREHPEYTVNDLSIKSGKPYSALVDLLFQLEMSDLIISIPGGRYAYVEM